MTKLMQAKAGLFGKAEILVNLTQAASLLQQTGDSRLDEKAAELVELAAAVALELAEVVEQYQRKGPNKSVDHEGFAGVGFYGE